MTMTNKTRSQQRGRRAGRPGEIPRKGWKDILLRVKEEQKKDNLSIVAAGVAFYALLALFPALATLISIYGIFADPAQVQQQIAELSGFLPQETRQLLSEQISRIASTSSGALGIGAIGGLLVSLWSANKGMKALMTALDIVYNEDETRGFFKINGISLLLTFVGILTAVISLALIAVIPVILEFIGIPGPIQAAVAIGRWPFLALVIVLLLGVLYRYAPNRDEPQWKWVSWGSVAATVLWIAVSLLFSFYVSNFGSYNKTYGSMGAIIILLMWFFLTAYAVLIGAELNAEMEHQTGKDTTRGEARPMGDRDAHVADTLGRKAEKKRR
jgi:membrane protein